VVCGPKVAKFAKNKKVKKYAKNIEKPIILDSSFGRRNFFLGRELATPDLNSNLITL
jgi:hypothetical protein